MNPEVKKEKYILKAVARAKRRIRYANTNSRFEEWEIQYLQAERCYMIRLFWTCDNRAGTQTYNILI